MKGGLTPEEGFPRMDEEPEFEDAFWDMDMPARGKKERARRQRPKDGRHARGREEPRRARRRDIDARGA